MKYFLITILFLLLTNGCSTKNAYSEFEMSDEEELITTYTQSSKIKNKDGVIGIMNGVYIINTDKVYFDDLEHFLVSIYMKDQNENYNFKLNKKIPIAVKELEDIKEFSTYIKNPKKWEKHYIVSFKKSGKTLNLILENKGSDLSVLRFKKF